MARGGGILGGLGMGVVGATLMYVFDPAGGNRRRARVRDAVVHWAKTAAAGAGVTARDAGNRARGLIAETRARLRREPVADDVLGERVRAELGRIVSHPRAIDVQVDGGRVTLSGVVLAREADRLRRAVAAVPGVRAVASRLEVHETAGSEPSLQGGVPRRAVPEVWQTRWSPTTRTLAGLLGTGLVALGVRRLGALGLGSALAGVGLLGRAATNLELRRLLGIGRAPRAVEVWKTIRVDAPPETVYALWREYANFPRFMANVREVRDLGNGRSRWVVAGPGGVPVEYEAELTHEVPGQLLGWRTVPGSVVDHAGVVRFHRGRDGATRVHVRLSYIPPEGAVGHGVAALFGADPKRQMDADLARMKTLLETGRPPRDALGVRPYRS